MDPWLRRAVHCEFKEQAILVAQCRDETGQPITSDKIGKQDQTWGSQISVELLSAVDKNGRWVRMDKV